MGSRDVSYPSSSGGKQTGAKPRPGELRPSLATIPLTGIDIAFYSTFFHSGVAFLRTLLTTKVNQIGEDLQIFCRGNYLLRLLLPDRSFVFNQFPNPHSLL